MNASLREGVQSVDGSFRRGAAPRVPRRGRSKSAAPFSLRLSVEERAKLEAAAAGAPLGGFIREKLFEGDLTPRRRSKPAPVKDHMALAQVLGMLGNLRLANNLNQLARAANMGALPLTPEELIGTCAAVLAIRAELMRALGHSAEGEP